MSAVSEKLKNKIFNGLGWKLGERLLNQGITFVVSLVLARILEPSDYGLVAKVYIFITIANVFVVNGFSAALIQKQDADDEDFSTILICSFGLSVLMYVVLYVSAPFIAVLFNSNKLISIVRVLSTVLPLSSCNAIWNAFLSRKLEFREIFIATLIGTIVSGTIGIIMAMAHFGVWALVAQMIINQMATTIALIKLSKWIPKLKLSTERVTPMIKFGASVLGADLIGTVFNQLNAFVIGLKYSDSQLAFYNRGQSIPYIIANTFNSVSAGVYFPALSRLNGNVQEIKALTRKSTELFAYILLPFYFGLIAVADNMILVLLTDKWVEAAPFLKIVCIASIIGTIAPLDLQVLKAYGRSDIVFKLEFIKKPLWAIFTGIAVLRKSLMAIALVLPIATLMEIIVNSVAVSRLMRYTIEEKVKDWLGVVVPSLIMFGIVQSLNLISINSVMLLIIQIVSGVGVYVGISIIIGNKQYIIIKEMIKEKLHNTVC